jgi:hypothetical protein
VITNVDPTLALAMIAIAVVVMIMIVVARAIDHAVVTIPPLVARAVAMLVLDQASRHQAQSGNGNQ